MGKISRRFALTMCLAMCGIPLFANDEGGPASKPVSEVTPTAGESWLNHLHRPFGDTSMGKTGRLGPAPSASVQETAGWEMGLLPSSPQSSTLHGADLYRLNCQGCHGPEGLGAPPEINSVIDPVRATSLSLVVARMKKSGMEMSPAAATELTKQAQLALLERLHSGGQDMPAFPQLNEAEVRALIAYLNELAGVPGARQLEVTETPVRVGELIVKSTCHTCHDATGPNPTAQQLEDGAIPPLETLTTRVDQMELIRKVTDGAPITMGTPPAPHRGRMPVFFYLSKNEAADVYLYLSSYPPSPVIKADTAVAAVQQSDGGGGAGGGGSATLVAPTPAPPVAQKAQISTATVSDGIPDWMITLLLIALAASIGAAIVGGLCFAAYELCRLGREGEYHNVVGFVAKKKEERHAGDLVA